MKDSSAKYILLITGLVAGFMSASLGIGGGVIFVPVLLAMNYEKKAMGTSLAAIVPCALTGALLHHHLSPGSLCVMPALIIMCGSIAGAFSGARLVDRLDTKYLKICILLLLFSAGIRYTGLVPGHESPLAQFHPAFFLVLGLAAGFSSALLGIGGGVIMVPGMNLLFGMGIHSSIATSLAVIVPTTLAGAVFHNRFDNIDRKASSCLVPASLAGSVCGALFANNMSAPVLKTIFGVLLIASSLVSILKKPAD